MYCHLTFIFAKDIRKVFTNPGLLAKVGQPTGTSEHVNDIISVTCYRTLDMKQFSFEGVMKSLCFGVKGVTLGTSL